MLRWGSVFPMPSIPCRHPILEVDVHYYPLSELEYVNTKRAAKELGIAVITLKKWRMQGKGPPFIKLETRRVLYPTADLIAYREASTVRF